MCLTKRLIAILLCALLCATVVPAQDRKAESQANHTIAPIAEDVMIIIQQQQVRFTGRSTVEEMRLQIFDQTGEMVYDSGAVAGPELNWPLQNANGETVKSGLYAYTLSIKEAGKETGAEKARERRGHFIIDRAADRDTGVDRLWITSRDSGGIGTELTVARNEETTVAGTSTSSERNERTVGQRRENSKRDISGRGIETETQSQMNAGKASVAAAPTGTVGRIAKFTSATDLGDSGITELNGNVGVGTTAPVARLAVRGDGTDVVVGSAGCGAPTAAIGFGSMSGCRDFALGGDVSEGASAGTVINRPLGRSIHFRENNGPDQMFIAPGGRVGIGTTSLNAKLFVEAAETFGIFSRNTASDSLAVFGQSFGANGTGVLGRYDGPASSSGWGVFGFSPSGFAGVFGAGGKNGVFGQTASASANDSGVNGRNDGNGYGVVGSTANGYAGVFGSGSQNGVFGRTSSADAAFSGVYGRNEGNGWGVTGSSVNGNGVLGETANVARFGGYFRNAAGGVALKVEGTAQVGVLQITGADFAENFDVNVAAAGSEATTTKAEPGMVVSIDPTDPGKLALSTQAYDRRVAGIISGAGGVRAGMMMSQPGTLAHGKHPVALSGRVYCWVDASRGAIKPGDLLTTSRTPGHAMKVANPAKAQGAIIGKAMTGLQRGKGLVLVLVTLQ